MAVVYLHKRNDTNEVFYVGIGKTDKRAFSKHSRNKYWKHIVEKVGYTIDILVSQTPWEDACKLEKLLIEKYGRRDLGMGSLVNMTDGGEGNLGLIFSDETIQKMSKRNKGEKNPMYGKTKEHSPRYGKPHTDETIAKIIAKNTGKTRSEETKENMTIAQRNKEGVKGYYYNKDRNKYYVRIGIGGKSIFIGSFNTPSEAEEAYKNARIKYFS